MSSAESVGVVALIVLTAAGCARSSPVTAGSVVRDSRGIRIVETTTPGHDARATWRAAGSPSIVIGDRSGEAYELFRVSGPARLSHGRLIVANGQPPELRIYDASGKYLRTVGQAGAGPGEFRVVTTLTLLAGDSAFTFDAGFRRATVFTRSGDLFRSATLGVTAGKAVAVYDIMPSR